jgi:hypothetical protein
MAGSATGPGMMPTKGMPQQMLASGTPTAGIKPAPNAIGMGQMYAGGTPDFNERTGMGYLGGTRDFDESANPSPFPNEIGGGPTPASGGKGGGQQGACTTKCISASIRRPPASYGRNSQRDGLSAFSSKRVRLSSK